MVLKLSTAHSAASLTSYKTVARPRKLLQLPKDTFVVNGMPATGYDTIPNNAWVTTAR